MVSASHRAELAVCKPRRHVPVTHAGTFPARPADPQPSASILPPPCQTNAAASRPDGPVQLTTQTKLANIIMHYCKNNSIVIPVVFFSDFETPETLSWSIK